eukprot:TRINITY_DN16952_c0_g1_i1.p1 TRINITY_DN16952_c0_g1~~TRINITY_DN16952_c0_g1_i1.p1  ORF type:complete len:260 (+),score=71.39 TRINITY_DN16952_c0_g1_i1:54-782(+)
MVYFECQKCNETVKKPKLAKHLQMCGSWWVSCIDCNKVFGWDEWEAHTSCISEAQKYQGNLYNAKENQNKGQVKQDSWIENVGKAIADPASSISPQIKGLLEKLLGFDNIPRKQKPFGNFVKNSVKIWEQSKIDAMWDVIAKANVKPAAAGGAGNAKPGEAPKAAKDEKVAWAGWKRALDDELESSGGSLPWKQLCTELVRRYRDSGSGKGEDDAALATQALASIPESYCSKCSATVKLPDK